jgi:hypothetical protein
VASMDAAPDERQASAFVTWLTRRSRGADANSCTRDSDVHAYLPLSSCYARVASAVSAITVSVVPTP